jgi:hypothetical protein
MVQTWDGSGRRPLRLALEAGQGLGIARDFVGQEFQAAKR